jgi:Rod binding protein.
LISIINGLSAFESSNYKNNIAQTNEFETILKNALEKKDDEQLKKACQDFESIFVSMVLRNMRATIPKDDLYNNSFGMDIFTSMLDDEYAKKISEAGGFGLADILYKQLSDKV